jgi:hypothetical protein
MEPEAMAAQRAYLAVFQSNLISDDPRQFLFLTALDFRILEGGSEKNPGFLQQFPQGLKPG